MARTGTRPTTGKIAGSLQYSDEQSYVDSKAIQPGLNDAWSAVVKFDDEYFPPAYTMTGNIEYTIDATNAATGNGRKDTIIGNGGTITFTGFTIKDSSLFPTSNVVTTESGIEYTIVFLRVGTISEVYLKANSLGSSAAKSITGNGIDSYLLETTRHTDIEPQTGSTKTWSWWMYGESGNGNAFPWSIGDTATAAGVGRAMLSFWVSELDGTNPNKLRVLIYQTSTVYRLIQSSIEVSRDAWHHIGVTYTESTNTIELYIDGTKDASATRSDVGSWTTGYNNRSQNRIAILGSHSSDGGAITPNFVGHIDEFSVWSKVLDATEMSEIYNSGVPTDLDSHSAVANRVSWLKFQNNLNDEDSLINTLVNNNCTFSTNVPS